MKYAHIFPPLDTTTFDCVHKRHCAFDTSSRTLKKSHTALLVAMLVQNNELNKNTLLLNCEHFYYILNERGVYGDRLAACINDSITKSKVYANELYFTQDSTLFYKRNRKLKNRLSPCIFCTALVSFKLSLYFFRLQAPLVTNALIPTSIFVSYYCQMSSSDSEKGDIEISLILVGAPKQRLKDDNADFQVFLSEI